MRPSSRARFKPFNPQAGPWLIWSYKWGSWHMRSASGGAAGYTTDPMQAGIFDEATARAYHDPKPHRNNVSIPASQVLKMLEAGLAMELDEYVKNHLKLQQIRARIAENQKKD